MAEYATPTTCGVDHVGLSVRDLESSRRFFCDCLGWRVVGERPEYPAVFVSDSQLIVTLWRVEAPDQAAAFDRRWRPVQTDWDDFVGGRPSKPDP